MCNLSRDNRLMVFVPWGDHGKNEKNILRTEPANLRMTLVLKITWNKWKDK